VGRDLLRVGACLSLSGKFGRFGRQAALGLEAWQFLDGDAELVIEDDRSDRHTLEAVLPSVASRCDVLLGPYSTVLMRAAGQVAAESGYLIWNHGGSGDDVERAHPGHVLSVLTPASRYGEPFMRFLVNESKSFQELCVVHGPGRFGRQVADGAAAAAAQLGIRVIRAEPDGFPPPDLPGLWNLFSAGVFEQDTALVSSALRLPTPPQLICTVSAGVRDFTQEVDNPDGIFGLAQWFPGSRNEALLGPGEAEFMRAFAPLGGGVPDYPAVQAAAAAVIAAHCARLSSSTQREDLWAAAAALDTSTLFGGFRVDPSSGIQVRHETVLVRWSGRQPAAVPAPARHAA
jgi:ABC-type branched-subunit amino acid transport system substrate-binding protein